MVLRKVFDPIGVIGCVVACSAYALAAELPSAQIQELPFFASIEVNGQFACPASIVDDYYVMTTNSCVGALDLNSMYVRVGTSKLGVRGQLLKATEIATYTILIFTGAADLAMVKVANSFSYNAAVMWINPDGSGMQEEQTGILPVWSQSSTKGSALVQVPVIVQNSTACSDAFSNGEFNVTSSMFCMSAQGSNSQPCLATLGTPFVADEQLYGMVVYNAGCDSSLPVVVLGIADYTSFLVDTLVDLASMFV